MPSHRVIGPAGRWAVRLTEWVANFLVAWANCGPTAALEIFVVGRWSRRPRRVLLRGIGVEFSFRGRLDYGVVSHFYRPGYRIADPDERVRWIIDAGANIGDETVKFRHFHPQATVVALEVDDRTVEVLRRNVGCDPRVHVEHKALWPRSGERLELVQGDNPESTSARPSPTGEVETVSLARLKEIYGFPRIDILKLDIEGSEAGLFEEGAVGWMDMVDVVIMEVADHESPGGLQRMLTAFPYSVDCTVVGENIVAIRRGCGLRALQYRYL